MKRMAKICSVVWLVSWLVVFAQTSDSSGLAQALKRTINPGAGLAQWQDLPQYPVVLSNTVLSDTEEPTPVTFSGYYSLAWDDTNLYLLGVFNQPQETLAATLPTDAPEWWTGDTLEIFVRPEGQEKLHFAMNPAGTPFAEFTSSVNYQAVSQVEETRWILEVALPLGDVLPAVTVGDIWEFKVGRGYVGVNEYSLWPKGGDFQGEANFGSVFFTETLEDPEALYTRLAPGLE